MGDQVITELARALLAFMRKHEVLYGGQCPCGLCWHAFVALESIVPNARYLSLASVEAATTGAVSRDALVAQNLKIALRKATTQLQILRDRAEGCDALTERERRAQNGHELSLVEVPPWIKEHLDLLSTSIVWPCERCGRASAHAPERFVREMVLLSPEEKLFPPPPLRIAIVRCCWCSSAAAPPGYQAAAAASNSGGSGA